MDALTMLGELRVATPCQANWDDMPGDDRIRSCPACSRSVYNIAAMTAEEAASLITAREGRLCARLFRWADGTIVTADCPPAEARPRPRSRFRRLDAAAIILVALLLVLVGREDVESPPSGSAVTWDDWVQWASVSLGLKPTPPAAPVLTPRVMMGDLY